MGKKKVKLPHGSVSVANIKDGATRDAIRKVSENIVALARAFNEEES